MRLSCTTTVPGVPVIIHEIVSTVPDTHVSPPFGSITVTTGGVIENSLFETSVAAGVSTDVTRTRAIDVAAPETVQA